MTPGETYATVDDVAALWRPLSQEEKERVAKLLPVVSDSLRQEAKNRGRDLDCMIESGAVLESVAKAVTVDIVARAIMTPTATPGDMGPMSQYSQSALGYTVSGTFLVPGGGLFIKTAELARLGLCRQRIGVIDLYAPRRDCDPAGKECDRGS